MFILGCPNLKDVDLRSLLAILNDRSLESILNDKSLEGIPNLRLFRLKERNQLQFFLSNTAGKWHHEPDAMSRFPTRPATELVTTTVHLSTPDMDHVITNADIGALTETSHDGAISWSELQSTGAKDPTYVFLLQTVQDCFPGKGKMTQKSSAHSGGFLSA